MTLPVLFSAADYAKLFPLPRGPFTLFLSFRIFVAFPSALSVYRLSPRLLCCTSHASVCSLYIPSFLRLTGRAHPDVSPHL
jgi:hypothetical protein